MTRAVAKYIRMSPRKLRRVIDVIRGKDALGAKTTLKFMPYAAAKVVEKVLVSAISNAKENEKLEPAELRITKAYVDQSSTLRRWRAMSRGRGYPILKRTSHVTIELASDPSLANKVVKRGKSAQAEHKHDHAHEHKHDHHDHKHEDHKEKKSKDAPSERLVKKQGRDAINRVSTKEEKSELKKESKKKKDKKEK